MATKKIEIHTWVFARGNDERYVKMTQVFQHSCHRHGFPCVVHEMDTPSLNGREAAVSANHYKLLEWRDMVKNLPDGEVALISDSDMLMINPIPDNYFRNLRNVGLTNRQNSRLPFNAGVVAVKGGEASVDFFEQWVKFDTLLYKNPDLHRPYRAKYAGMNQASLGFLLEEQGKDHLDFYPCSELNACQPWKDDLTNTYMVHIKSALRKAVFGGHTIDPDIVKLRRMWREEAKRAGIGALPSIEKTSKSLAGRYRKSRRRSF